MDDCGISDWDEIRLEAEFKALMEIAREHLHPEWESGEVVVLKTAKNRIFTIEIPDFQDYTIREPLENQCISTLVEQDDTEVILCVATINGKHPEIPSWNLRSRLVEINAANLHTNTVLWGGGELYILKSFSRLLPPNKE